MPFEECARTIGHSRIDRHQSGGQVNTPPSMRPVQLGIIALVLVLLASAWHFGVFSRVGEPRALADTLIRAGAWGYLTFVVAYALLQPFGVPGTGFVVAASLIWPWPTAFALSMVGTMAASVVGFSFARFVARDWVSARIPQRLRKYDAALERSAFQTVVVLRLIFWMQLMLHSFFGVSKVGFWTHFWGSVVGYALPLLLVSYLASSMFDAAGSMQPGAWPIMAGLIALSVVIAVVARAWERGRLSASRAGQSPAGHENR
jgi:uncharacterized membrane protein YdjX (TVP38/TMEM64 family)